MDSGQPKAEHPSLLVFADDWGRHPSSCQHLVRELLPRYSVTWVNTIGMRRPRLDGETLRRGAEKICKWVSHRGAGGENGATELDVLQPVMWPWFSTGIDRWVNGRLLVRQLSHALNRKGERPIAITTLPITADLVGRLPVTAWVYYCVDDFSKWPSLHQSMINVMEMQLARRAEVVITASDHLTQRLTEFGASPTLITHGVDLSLWRAKHRDEPVPELDGVTRPIFLFWGSINWQIDIAFVKQLSADLEYGTIVFLGPKNDVDPRLLRIPKVKWLPPQPYEMLPRFSAQAAVLIMPYLDAPGLQESQPLKLKEYLATGNPAVVRDLPANRLWKNALDMAKTPEEFSTLARKRAVSGLPNCQAQARKQLERESWIAKARCFESLILSSQQQV